MTSGRDNAENHRLQGTDGAGDSLFAGKVLFILNQLGQTAARDRDAVIADARGFGHFHFELFGRCGHARMIDATPNACNRLSATGGNNHSQGSENRRFSNRGRAFKIRSPVVCSVLQDRHNRSRSTNPAVCRVR